MITIYTDGSTHSGKNQVGAKNIGGFGVVILKDDIFWKCYAHEETNTTNNIQEMKAILYAFLNYGYKDGSTVVYSDSSYCVNSFTKWIFGWSNKGWLKSDGNPPENLELIKAYYNWYQQGHRIQLKQIRGHQGILWNEVADQLATGKLSCEEVMKKYGKE